jgi:phosphoglycerate dehydrogenase-like enzyme
MFGSATERPDIVAAILGRGSSALPADILDKLPRLAVVGIAALSLARHEPEALLARGIRLLNASAAYAESVAEFALGLAILGRRRAFLSHDVMRAGGWGTVPACGRIQRHVVSGRTRFASCHEGGGTRNIFPASLEERLHRLWACSGQSTVRPRDLQGATVGLVGWGENARAFAERLGRAQARVLVYSENARKTISAAAVLSRFR